MLNLTQELTETKLIHQLATTETETIQVARSLLMDVVENLRMERDQRQQAYQTLQEERAIALHHQCPRGIDPFYPMFLGFALGAYCFYVLNQ